MHGGFAEVTDPRRDGERRARHRARAATGPDEDVAGELERSATRARARAGLAAAAAFLERAATLTRPGPPDGALAKFPASAIEVAQQLLTVAEAGPLEEHLLARVDLLRAHLTFVTSRGGDAPLLLVRAAGQLASTDPGLARETYLDALSATVFAGHLASPGGGALDVARAASTAPQPLDVPRSPDLLLSGLAANFTDGYAAEVPPLRQALASFGEGMSADEELRWLWLITEAVLHLWDDGRWETLSARYVHLARTAGALSELPLALSTRAYMLLFTGDLATATSLTDERRAVADATGGNIAPYSAMALAAFRGSRAEALALIESTGKDVTLRGESIGAAVATWANAVLHNGLGEYPEAMAAAHAALR